MLSEQFLNEIEATLEGIQSAGLFKAEVAIEGAQGAEVQLPDGRRVLNFCANNYLGLANSPEVVAAAEASLKAVGFGMASVRFICGTQSQHLELEKALSRFLGKEDCILYAACFDANGGVFEPLFGAEDAIVSDQLNHASIIDGIRLCKARRYRYRNNDATDLEAQLKAARADGARHIIVVTDGVFSMDGIIADLPSVTRLARQYEALVMVDDCHSTGFLGKRGRGTHEHHEVEDAVDLISGTLGKALGGASGGFIAGPAKLISLLRQRSRPYLFSNTLAPPIVAASLAVIERLEADTSLRDRLMQSTETYRTGLQATGLVLGGATHPIVPVMVGDAALSQTIARRLLELGIYAVGFFYPVVPKGQARIRTQISAAHSEADIAKALEAWQTIAREFPQITAA
jgi:glycine C-acetyltransferase